MLIIFDLDGTLIDSAKDLATSMNATRAYVGMPPLDSSVIYSYVGNGAAMLVRRALGPTALEELIEDALTYFLKFYRSHALEYTELYPGVRDLIERLAADGHTLSVLTNKPVRISVDILAALGVAKHFARVYGGDSFPTKKPDPAGVTTLIQETASRKEKTLLVGDSGVDVQTARNAGVQSCGVRWGFQPEAFATIPPDYLIETPAQLLGVLNGKQSALALPSSPDGALRETPGS